MNDSVIYLDDKSEKKSIRNITVIFGFMCILTGGWWAVFLIRYPDNDNSYWAATAFLLLFGLYLIYDGLGYARRYIYREAGSIHIRQNSLLPKKNIEASTIEKIEIRSMDLVFIFKDKQRFRLKLGLKYPDLGQKIKDYIVQFAEETGIELFYKHETI